MSTSAQVSDLEKGAIVLGNGAQFWAYISPQHNTSKAVTKWTVTLTQGNWTGEITSADPYHILQTPNLSGIFTVTVWASGPHIAWQKLTPLSDSKPDIGCNSNCAGMIGIVANANDTGANYWTVWDAVCKRGAA